MNDEQARRGRSGRAETCSATLDTYRCTLPKGHDGRHEDRRGAGAVNRSWPVQNPNSGDDISQNRVDRHSGWGVVAQALSGEPPYRYSTNFGVTIAARGLDDAARIAREIRALVVAVDGVVEVEGGTYPRHRNDLDHALADG